MISQHKQQAVNPLFSLSSVLFASDGSSTVLQIIMLTQKNWLRGKCCLVPFSCKIFDCSDLIQMTENIGSEKLFHFLVMVIPGTSVE